MKLVCASAMLLAVASASGGKGPGVRNKLRGNERIKRENDEKDRELVLGGGDDGGLGGIFDDLEDGFEETFGGGTGGGTGGWGGISGGDSSGGMGTGGHTGLGSHSFGDGEDPFGCSDSCKDDGLCESFMMSFDPTSKFEDACNAGCFPKMTLDMCERLNCDSDEDIDEETQVAASTAVARMGLTDLFNTDAAMEMMCGDCKFYSCCLNDNEVGDTTKYEACKVHLVDNTEEQALGNSVLDELAAIFGEAMDGLADAVGMGDADGDGEDGFGSVLNQILESFGDAVEGFAEDFDLPIMWNFSVTDWGDGAVWSGTETTSGVSVFGQVAGSFVCPYTCTNKDLCEDVFTGMAAPQAMEDACNAGCLPGPESCDDVCGASAPDSTETAIAIERFIDFEAVTNMACQSCRFLACCNGQQSVDGDATVSKFDTCSELLPDPSELWTNFTDGEWTWEWDGIMDWVDSVDWSAVAEDLGLSELFASLQSLLEEALAGLDFLEETPISCNKDTCPITGLCEMDVDLQSLDLGDMCARNAFFDCGDGLEEACAAQCQGDGGGDGIKAPFCALCDLATCCSTSEEEGKSFEDCALAALPEDLAATIDDVSSSPSEEEGEGDAASSPEPSAPVNDTPASESTSGEIGTSSAGTAVVVEDALPEPAGDESSPLGGEKVEEEQAGDRPAGVPVESSSGSSAESAFEFQASRASVENSASYCPGISTLGVTLASVAAWLVMASF